MEFFQTRGGKIFFEGHVPRMVRALEAIADALPELVMTLKNRGPKTEQDVVPIDYLSAELSKGARWVGSFTDPRTNEAFAVIEKPVKKKEVTV